MIKGEKIYVVCPANGRTGGLELLHQLTYSLNKLGRLASIAYIDAVKGKSPLNEAYIRYVHDFVFFEDIPDTPDTVVILSEQQVDRVHMFKNARVVVWWLSVDNFLKMYDPKSAYLQLGLKGVLWYIKNRRWRYSLSKLRDEVHYSLAQSYYAMDFLKKKGFTNISYLSDYISLDYLEPKPLNPVPRKNVVLYNPKKGLKFTQKLIEAGPHIEWRPLINMTNEEVLEALTTSKIYIDFGNHPGKDRFPREAAISGCCVITGEKGSAHFFEDVSVPGDFKHVDDIKSIPEIIDQINYIFQNFDDEQGRFSDYRNRIRTEPSRFESDIQQIFGITPIAQSGRVI